uniref:S-adenosyl-L-methionine-dependent methyltransferase n=1 Tax=Proboscia inermis TaxID=420281 RepID=A0A7S0C6Y8_9STRA
MLIISIRTRYLDDQINSVLRQERNTDQQQLVIVGAGLDARVFRMQSLLNSTGTTTFEIDFPNMLVAKREIFAASGFSYKDIMSKERGYTVRHVESDLTVPNLWREELIRQGFDPSQRTVWLIEGFTGYLTNPELDIFLKTLTKLSAQSSVLLSTWIESDSPTKTSMHRSFANDPSSIVEPFGWSEIDVQSVHSAGDRMGRKGGSDHFTMSCHEKKM